MKASIFPGRNAAGQEAAGSGCYASEIYLYAVFLQTPLPAG